MQFLKLKSLLAVLENSIKGGDNYLFRNLYFKNDNGEVVDILEDGGNSCAVFVSWILLAFELIKTSHATVASTIKDLELSGWYEIKEPRPGAVIAWESLEGGGGKMHSHIGFYIGDSMAVSNDSRGRGFPHKHHWTYNDSRKVEKIYWHPGLDNG